MPKKNRHKPRYKAAVGENLKTIVLPTADAERFICPRYQIEGGARFSEYDRWQHDRWLNPLGKPDIVFPEGFVPPITCSYCGGAAPSDVLQLMAQGWEGGATTKDYKRYLYPPGYHLHTARISRLYSANPTENFEDIPKFISPTPPVKIYFHHFTMGEIEQFNKHVIALIEYLDQVITGIPKK